jgi:hypothetical protein
MPSKTNKGDRESPGTGPARQDSVVDRSRDTSGELHKKYEGFDEQKSSNDPRYQGDYDVNEHDIDERTNNYRDPSKAREEGE